MSPTHQAPGLDQVVGQNLERLRRKRGWSQDDLVSRGWLVGLPWSRMTIATLGSGKRAIGLGEVVLIALAARVSVNELLAGGGQVLIGDGSRMPLSDVRAVVTGDAAEPDDLGLIAMRVHVGRRQAYEQVMLSSAGEAEQKAARRLGVSPQTIAEAAYDTWRRSLTDERNSRVEELTNSEKSARSVQALRGHVTRQLLNELENLMSANPDIYPGIDTEE